MINDYVLGGAIGMVVTMIMLIIISARVNSQQMLLDMLEVDGCVQSKTWPLLNRQYYIDGQSIFVSYGACEYLKYTFDSRGNLLSAISVPWKQL